MTELLHTLGHVPHRDETRLTYDPTASPAARVVASVEPVTSVPTRCVAVDAADALYLCGRGFVATHNTGNAPGLGFEGRALFQLRIYALVIWRSRGVIPKRLQLVYLGNREVVAYDPDEADLLATERKVDAIWAAIQESTRTGEFTPSPGKQCDWCPYHALCPVYGGTIPPLPAPATRWALLKRRLRHRWRDLRRATRR